MALGESLRSLLRIVMFWFVIIVLIALLCAGITGLVLGIRLLKFGEDVSTQKHTLRIVLFSLIEILAAGFALAGVATKVGDPLIALISTLMVLLVAKLGLRSIGRVGR